MTFQDPVRQVEILVFNTVHANFAAIEKQQNSHTLRHSVTTGDCTVLEEKCCFAEVHKFN